MLKSVAGTLLLLLGSMAMHGVSAPEPTPLTPYNATYQTKAMGVKVKIKRELLSTEDGYTLTSNGSSMLAKIKESARFKLMGEQIQGVDYQYQLKSVVGRKSEVIFLPEAGVIKSLKKATGQNTRGLRVFSTNSANKSSYA